jgi:hypothetical protein
VPANIIICANLLSFSAMPSDVKTEALLEWYKPFKLLCHAFRCKDRGIVGMVQLRYDSMVMAHLLKLMNSIEHLVAAC